MFPRILQWTRLTFSAVVIVATLLVLTTTMGLLSTAATARSNTVTKAHVNLRHSPHGMAHLVYDADKKTLVVTTHLIGLAPNSTHPAHINSGGTCANPSDTVKYMLQNVVSDQTGQAYTTTVIPNVTEGIPATGWFITIHNGPGLTPAAQYTPISCGDIRNANQSGSADLWLGSSQSPNESASGTSSLSLDNGTLTVVLNVQGLAPNSTHAVHIHAGNCLNTQKVLYDMSPLQADANGNVSKTVTFNGVTAIPTSGWDINVHYSNDLSTQTGYNPILCGNVSVQ